MHEVSLCRQLASAVLRAVGEREVQEVHIDVGALRQVVPEAMEFAWPIVVRGTALDGARLLMRELPAIITCDECGVQTRLGAELGFDCPACGSSTTRVTSGEEFVLRSVDVRTACDEPDGELSEHAPRGVGRGATHGVSRGHRNGTFPQAR